MAKQYIDIMQIFNAPIETVFAELTDHEKFGKLLKADIKRIVDGGGGYVNGLGSVRKITPLPLADFEETVVTFEPNQLMEYVISKGSPLKNYKGRMEFSSVDNTTRLRYTIEFESKLSLLGGLLKVAVEMPIKKGLSSLAKSYM
jgi:uncharacterized protein YndB with AHSA1/START domain